MDSRTFKKGGVHPGDQKSRTAGLPIEAAPEPSRVTIMLTSHLGAPAKPLVRVGDTVRVGQPIGEPGGHVSAFVHSSVSGKVTAVGAYGRPTWKGGIGVTIESDGLFETHGSVVPRDPWSLSAEGIREAIRAMGIVGMGGAAFPTHVKYGLPAGKKADVVALNGAECEPYLTCDHRTMLEKADGVISGLRLLMKASGAERGIIGVEENKPDAISALTKAASEYPFIRIDTLATRYPQGEERLLLQAATGREVPSGALPIEVGAVVDNITTALAVYESILTGMPLIKRVVTVTGDGVANPKNLLARVGTYFSHLIEACGGFSGEPGKVVSGGPMTGVAVHNTSVPVTKGTSGILVIPRAGVARSESGPCLKCARCVDACPYSLLPLNLAAYSRADMLDEARELRIMDCRECGCCSFVCPSRIEILQTIRMGKAEINRRKQA